VIDEFAGEYRNFHRLLALGQARTPRPWLDTLRPAAHALRFARGHPAEDALSVPPDRTLALRAALVAAALIVGGWLAARRRAATAALALVTALALIAVPIDVRYVPGRTLPSYQFEWASIVTLAALLVVGTEILARATRQHPSRYLAVGMLAALSGLLVANAMATAASTTRPRDATSAAIEDATRAIQARAAADLPPGRRFLVRVAAEKNQDVELGLILALDKAGLRFGVEPFGSCRLEGHFTPRGDEWAELLVGPLPSREGAVPIGTPGGIRVVWQRLWGRAGDVAAPRSP
jgi:hypothetical protein